MTTDFEIRWLDKRLGRTQKTVRRNEQQARARARSLMATGHADVMIRRVGTVVWRRLSL